MTGELVGPGQLDADYWWYNVRQPVRFVDGMAALIAAGHRIVVEIGANPVLQAYLHDALRVAETQGQVLGTLSRKDAAGDPFPAIAARCHVAGYDLDRAPWFDGAADPRGLPLYPWQRERCWFEPTAEDPELVNPSYAHPLVGFHQAGPSPAWIAWLDPDQLPWLADHAIEGVPVMPAAAVVEMALATARLRRPEAGTLEIADLELRRPLPFDAAHGRELRTRLDAEDGEWELSSRPRLSDETPTVHAVARVATPGAGAMPPGLPAAAPARRVEAAALYDLAARLGLDYGARFRTVSHIDILAPGEAIVQLDAAPIGEPLEPYLIHPALLDGALQGLLALLADGRPEHRGVSFLPWRFGRVRLADPLGRVPQCAHLRVTRIGTRSAAADIALFDASGAAVAELGECWFRRVELSRAGSIDDRVLRVDLVPAPLGEAPFPAIFARLGATLGGLVGRGRDPAREAEQALLLDALSAAVAWQAVIGITGEAGAFSVEDLIEAGRVAAASEALLDNLLAQLARFGAASRDAGSWRLIAPNDLPEIDEVWRLLLAEAPALVSELAIVAASAEDLPRRLAEGPDTDEASHTPGFTPSLDASPAGAAGTRFVCDALAEIAAQWPAGRKLRILELGAGGFATRRFLETLDRSGVAFSYLATHPDPDEAARLGFAVAGATGAAASCWSPDDRDDPDDGGRFDIIASVDAVFRLQLDPAGLARLGALLVPCGILIAVEPEPNPVWDLSFGRFAWWWRGEIHRGGGSPLRSGAQWCDDLLAAGFAECDARPVAAGPWPNTALWARTAGRASERRVPTPGDAAIALVAEGACETLAAIGRELAARGLRAAIVRPGELEHLEGDHAVAIAVDEADDPAEGAARALPLMARTAAAAAQRRLPLWVLTRGAQQAEPGASCGLVGAALWGLGRVLVNEMPGLDLHLVDLPTTSKAAEQARCLAAELAGVTAEDEIVWTEAGRHVLRLRRGLPPRRPTGGEAIGLTSDGGGLDALAWAEIAPRPPGPGEVEIDVRAAGLNFRDVMWGMGLLPEEALIDGFAGPTFGLECAGTIRAVGPGVEGLAVGDRVAGLTPASLSTRATTVAGAVTPIPPDLGFAAAATVPVAFITAIYALGTLARLGTGETVLIHAAAGGVGLAAIQYAKHCGAVVIATAGSPVKRAFLRRAGADHAIDSRDLGFADAVRAITGGAGVDVVLNSLSGEAMDSSIALLKPFGRFLELGKRDFYLNRRMHLRPLRQNISYFAIDVDQLPIRQPELARSLMREIADALASGAIRPLAHRSFRFGEVEDAFRLMQASGHIGKIVLEPDDGAGVRLSRPATLTLRGDGAYLVTGGISGFGFEAARWLLRCGARRIALVGRRGADTPGAAARIAELTAAGAEVSVHAGDVGDRASLAGVLARVRRRGVLRGVVHAASAISDGLAIDIDATAAAAMLRPKLAGAVLLDELTRDDPLDLFILFSSATTLLGAPGQGVYVAANLALEALARQRRADGRPALAVGWGPIADAGYLADRPETRDALARRLGAKPMPAAQALAALPALLAGGRAGAAFAETSWSEARRYLPILTTSLFAEIRAEAEAAPSDESLIEQLASLDADGAVELLKTLIAEEAANILRLPASGIEPQRPLSELGMDSLMAVELRLALENRLRIDLPLMSLAEGTSVASIAGRLARAMSARPRIGELQGLAARYEVAEDAAATALVGEESGIFDAAEQQSAAAE